MEFTFEDSKLQETFEDDRLLRGMHGARRAGALHNRIAALRAVDVVSDLARFPGRWHPLVANWSEHWSGDLDHPYRLIIRAAEPPPRNADGSIIWTEVDDVVIVGVFDTHQ